MVSVRMFLLHERPGYVIRKCHDVTACYASQPPDRSIMKEKIGRTVYFC